MNFPPALARLRGIEKRELTAPGHSREVGRPNDVKYNTWYYGQRVVGNDEFPWCAVFQAWCFDAAGIKHSIFPKSAGVTAIHDWFTKKDRFFSTPKIGDLVVYHKRNGHVGPNHIGFVYKMTSHGNFKTIEGNLSDTVKFINVDKDDSQILGYCRPDYENATIPARSDGGTTEIILQGLPRLIVGSKGADVRRLHGLLRAAGHELPGIQNLDGTFKDEYTEVTKNAVRAFTGGRTTITAAQWAQLLSVS
jgi:uncharacterized protein (TIGR02594 family)